MKTNDHKLDNAFDKLGFKEHKIFGESSSVAAQEEALLKIYYFAGYFTPEKLWQDLNHISSFPNKEESFKNIMGAIKGAQKHLPDYDNFAQSLRQNLNEIDINAAHWMNLLLYEGQHAFNRTAGQERYELTPTNWMREHKTEYLKAATTLGLVDRISPALAEYDEAWIAGASRIGVLARVLDYKYLLSQKLKIKHEVIVLAGERELWAEIDGINPNTKTKLLEKDIVNIDELDLSLLVGVDQLIVDEGKEYMLDLASRFSIKYNKEQPFISYKTKEECPAGRFPGRTYLNYEEGETKKLTESLMSQDITSGVFGDSIEIIDTKSQNDQRPTTITTAKDVATKLIEQLSKSDDDSNTTNILYQCNNPYIERQALATQLVVNEVLKSKGLTEKYKIIVEGVGFGYKQDVATIHSELGALMAEHWKSAFSNGSFPGLTEECIKELLFQTRDKAPSEAPMPSLIEEIGLVGELVGMVEVGT